MTKYQPGDDIIVDIFGIEHQGEVVSQSKGWVVCIIQPDPVADYGAISPRMDPARTTVCVPESRIRHAQQPATTPENTNM